MYGKGTAQHFLPPLPESSASPSNPRAPIQPGLHSQSFSLGGSSHISSYGEHRSVCGAALAPPAARPPHQLLRGLEMLLSALLLWSPELAGAGALGIARNGTKITPRKSGRNHHPKSQQLNSTKEADSTTGELRRAFH